MKKLIVIYKGKALTAQQGSHFYKIMLYYVRPLSCAWLLQSHTVACQALLSMGFPGKNTGVGCHFLLQFYIIVCIYISI